MHLLDRSKKRSTFKRDFVPMNLKFVIHRNAEWAMLMLGESIFSLLIVPVEHTFEFTVVFILGTLITANVYYHHFELCTGTSIDRFTVLLCDIAISIFNIFLSPQPQLGQTHPRAPTPMCRDLPVDSNVFFPGVLGAL